MIPTTVREAEPRPIPKGKMSWDEFLQWTDEDTHAEWVNGDVIMTMPSGMRHQDIKLFLVTLLRQYVRAKKLGIVLDAPFLMRMALKPSGREPDILYVQEKNRKRLHETYLDGPADLVVEIISPESIARDRGDKFVEYEQAQVREYWLIDPVRTRAEFYVLDRKGQYRLVESDTQGRYYSQVVKGFWIKVDWLWQDPLPLEEDALKQIRRTT
jgi:Uma2 family endonuclease